MNITIEKELQEYMLQKNKHYIAVEVVTASTSDIEISELHVYLTNEKQAAILKEKKRCRGQQVEQLEVLFPSFPLQYEESVRFNLKRFLCFKMVGYEGMKI